MILIYLIPKHSKWNRCAHVLHCSRTCGLSSSYSLLHSQQTHMSFSKFFSPLLVFLQFWITFYFSTFTGCWFSFFHMGNWKILLHFFVTIKNCCWIYSWWAWFFQWLMSFSGVIFLPWGVFFLWVCWDPMLKFSCKTLTILGPNKFSTLLFKLSLVADMIFFKTASRFCGWIPIALNPLTIFVSFVPSTNLLNSKGKCSFRRVPLLLDSLHHSSSTDLHTRFIGAKTATSNGWQRCVEFDGRVMNLMFFYLHVLMTVTLKWDPQLSAITANGPSPLSCGIKISKNHLEKVLASNHPLFVVSNLVPNGTPLIQAG